MEDQRIYEKIGQLLINACPAAAEKVIVRAKIFPEGDGATYEFDYVDGNEVTRWFDPPARKIGELTELLVCLQKEFINDELVNEARIWRECEIKLDTKSSKIGINFSYND
ncbi:hypothetical protein M3S04_13370 [Xanthomonas sp. PPL139]|uniref:hypothetical protein n=1 Tax=unclassified Xanthomonas TaxID=2643310 RepID=UPI0033A1A07C